MRKSVYIGVLCLFFTTAFFLTLVDQSIKTKQAHDKRGPAIHLVKELGLTDLALFTEASYTRHSSQADRHTAFASHPVSFEHFPTGALVPLPKHLQQ